MFRLAYPNIEGISMYQWQMARRSILGVCTIVQYCVVNHSFHADLYVIPLDGFDIVLGIKWLQTLGPIPWDFALLTMSFQDSKQGEFEKVVAVFNDLFQEPALVADRHLKLPAYERLLTGLTKAVLLWKPYLLGRAFLIQTDHYNLKYLLDQRLTTSPQQHWLSKLMRQLSDYIAACSLCQHNKAVNLSPAGLSQPLQLPNQIWADVSMDFIDGLPKSGAMIFFENIVRLHGIPEQLSVIEMASSLIRSILKRIRSVAYQLGLSAVVQPICRGLYLETMHHSNLSFQMSSLRINFFLEEGSNVIDVIVGEQYSRREN
ncbi:hypothetical protein BC332_28316 [Capsicum chinense]|nr:hypothetical protein BC332_28316 [Capsicum chinense]